MTKPKTAELGEINRGTAISGEQAAALADAFAGKITELSRKPQLTQDETRFIDDTAGRSARIIIQCRDYLGLSAPQNPQKTVQLSRKAYQVAESLVESPEERASLNDEHDPMRQLDRIAGAALVAAHPELRMPVEEFATEAMSYFAAIVTENGSVTADNYLTENLQVMVASYDRIEPSQAPVPA